MNIQEAIKQLKTNLKGGCLLYSPEPIEMAIEALEKQIPKKPTKDSDCIYLHTCPECGKFVTQNRYCIHCGQKLDWSGEE